MAFKVDLDIDLNNISNDIERELEKVVARTVLKGEEQAKKNVPVDTGHLRRSLASEAEGLSGIVYTNVEYAMFVEFGTSKQKAQPFMIHALEAMEKMIVKETESAIERVLGK